VPVLLEFCNITKVFPGVVANDSICLEIEDGKIHALLGENGAGKSTLMNCLCGLYQPQSGEILLRGKKADINNITDSVRLGIGMIHQHFMLIPQLTVVENIAATLNSEDRVLLNNKKVRQRILELSERHHLEVDPDACIWQLSVGAQQRVEIIRALMAGAEILILDEPTAVLTPQEVIQLFHIMRELVKSGKTIIFISHKLDEVLEISDVVTVLRDGRIVGSVETKQTNKHELAHMMVGRDVLFRLDRHEAACGDRVLRLQHVHAKNSRELPALDDVSFDVACGEILGIAGVDGNGQQELADVITGMWPATSGQIFINEKEITNQSPSSIRQHGLAYIPAERKLMGTIGQLSVANNLVLASYDQEPFAHRGWLDKKEISDFALLSIKEFDIRTPNATTSAESLSGGNLQKVVLARELSKSPAVMICAQPTRGLDVGAIEYVHRRILEQRERGAGILLISTELEEIFALSDRIAVISRGKIMGIVPNKNVDIGQIGLMMAGTLQLPV
jgi:general nucleoside transport system ATP-binding protein